MRDSYRAWLEARKYEVGTITAQLHRVGRVETSYAVNLDAEFTKDRMETVISTLRYSKADQRNGRPNPSKIAFDGDIYNNLASYRNAVERYRSFCEEGGLQTPDFVDVAPEAEVLEAPLHQRIGLERDLQATLRMAIARLEPGLTIIDDGAERYVASGRIDITARDANGMLVAIELKAGRGDRNSVGQIAGYMGDLLAEEEGQTVRGILVAADFHANARSAARVVSGLILKRYSVVFSFSDPT